MAKFDVFSLAVASIALLLAIGLLAAYAINRNLTSFRWWAGGFVLLAISIATATLRLDPVTVGVRWVSWGSFYAAACVIAYGLYRQGATRNPLNRIGVGAMLLLVLASGLTIMQASPRDWLLIGPIPTLLFMLWSAVLVFRAGAWGYGVTLLAGIGAAVAPPLFYPSGPLGPSASVQPSTLRGAVGPGVDAAAPIPLTTPKPLLSLLDFAPPPGQRPPIEHPLTITLITIAALVVLAGALILRDLLARFDSMRERSTTDAMTGLLNRVTFEEAADALLAETAATPACLILFDIDHFKRINDTAGHAAGDHVIARLGQLLREATVLRYVAGRVGGEEFAVIISGTELGSARLFAETIRANFSASDFGIDIDWSVTLSAGIAMRQPGESLHSLTGRADKALYAAKAHGRDRVSAAQDGSDVSRRHDRGSPLSSKT